MGHDVDRPLHTGATDASPAKREGTHTASMRLQRSTRSRCTAADSTTKNPGSPTSSQARHRAAVSGGLRCPRVHRRGTGARSRTRAPRLRHRHRSAGAAGRCPARSAAPRSSCQTTESPHEVVPVGGELDLQALRIAPMVVKLGPAHRASAAASHHADAIGVFVRHESGVARPAKMLHGVSTRCSPARNPTTDGPMRIDTIRLARPWPEGTATLASAHPSIDRSTISPLASRCSCTAASPRSSTSSSNRPDAASGDDIEREIVVPEGCSASVASSSSRPANIAAASVRCSGNR